MGLNLASVILIIDGIVFSWGAGRTGEWEGMGEGKGKSWGVGGYWLCAQPLAQGVPGGAT